MPCYMSTNGSIRKSGPIWVTNRARRKALLTAHTSLFPSLSPGLPAQRLPLHVASAFVDHEFSVGALPGPEKKGFRGGPPFKATWCNWWHASFQQPFSRDRQQWHTVRSQPSKVSHPMWTLGGARSSLNATTISSFCDILVLST